MKALALKEAFRQNQAVIGTWVFEFNSSGIARLLASTGVDFVVYDMEHSGFGMDSIKALLSQSRPLDLAVLVRPPAGEYHLIGPLLDAGANGIIVPKVESAREAERIADACRYFPLGHRGAAFSISHDDYLSGNIPQKMKARRLPATTSPVVIISRQDIERSGATTVAQALRMQGLGR